MSKILLAQCLQNDVVQIAIDHYRDFLGDDIDVLCLPGVLLQVLEQQQLLNHILENYRSIYLDGHKSCAYYSMKGFIDTDSEKQQKLDICKLSAIAFEEYQLDGGIGFIEEDYSTVTINNQKYNKIIHDTNVDIVLLYPVDCWKNSFDLIKNIFSTDRLDRYGYFSSGLGSITNILSLYADNILNISVHKHKATKVIIAISENENKDSKLQKSLSNFEESLRKSQIPCSTFLVGSQKSELVRL